MEKELGKVQKNDTTDIIVRIDDFGGKRGLTIREFVTSDRYTGFTKQGTRIPIEKFLEFREIINKVNLNDLTEEKSEKTEEKVAETQEDEELEEDEEVDY